MPIRGLDSTSIKPYALCYSKIVAQVLEGTIVCVDGFWFLRKYGNIDSIHKMFTEKCDEIHISPVLQLINLAKRHNFQILWVWDGLDTYKLSINDAMTDLEALRAGYDSYMRNDSRGLKQAWKQLVANEDIVPEINTLLQKFGHEFVRSPYSATAQIAYYLKKGICGYGFCKIDATIYDGIDKIVSDFSFTDSSIIIFNKTEIQKKLELSSAQYKVLAFTLGCEYCPTVPEYADNFLFDNILQKVKNGNMEKHIRNEYADVFYKAYVTVEYHPVMNENGYVAYFNEMTVAPRDFNTIFGERLPDFLYSKFFLCKISCGMLRNLKNKNCDNIRKIGLSMLKARLDIPGVDTVADAPLKPLLCKNIKIFDDFDVSQQILLYHLIQDNILRRPFDKAASLLDFCTGININDIKDDTRTDGIYNLSYNYDVLEFVYLATTKVRYLKEVIQCYEIITNEQSNIKFDIHPLVQNCLYYMKHCTDNSNVLVKQVQNHIENINKFANANNKKDRSLIK